MVPHSLQHNTTTRSVARATAPSATVIGGIACGAATVSGEPRGQALLFSASLLARSLCSLTVARRATSRLTRALGGVS